jgi:hypothetical protein
MPIELNPDWGMALSVAIGTIGILLALLYLCMKEARSAHAVGIALIDKYHTAIMAVNQTMTEMKIRLELK